MISKHPLFNMSYSKWRLTYEGGDDFINKYLEKYSAREDAAVFAKRKAITYCPRFAGAGIDDIKNSIIQRLPDVVRTGGSKNYQKEMYNMSSFIGNEVLPELLVMGKVGIYVDMPPAGNHYDPTLHPYLYIYQAENIYNWTEDSVVLRDFDFTYTNGFPESEIQRFRHIYREDNQVFVQFYDEDWKKLELHTLPIFPFHLAEIKDSLLRNTADYQIALLNIASSDLSYSLQSNFTFYTEQYDPASESWNVQDGDEVEVGPSSARRYPIGADRPDYISPPSEPLMASMEKQKQLKEEIRELLNLDLNSMGDGDLAGLSYIGLELEKAERVIASIWAAYENSEIAEITYPEEYSLRTDLERRKEADELLQLRPTIPSMTYQKEVSKEAARLLLSVKITSSKLQKIYAEIDASPNMTGSPKDIREDVEAGILDLELASNLRLYPEGTADKAKADHVERLSRIQAAQMPGARGIDPEKLSGREEKGNTDENDTTVVNQRGDGK